MKKNSQPARTETDTEVRRPNKYETNSNKIIKMKRKPKYASTKQSGDNNWKEYAYV